MDKEQSRLYDIRLDTIRQQNSERNTAPVEVDPETKLSQFAIYCAEVSAS